MELPLQIFILALFGIISLNLFTSGQSEISKISNGNSELNIFKFFTENRKKFDTIALLKEYGYPSEVHHVVGKDGYILELHRIPWGLESPPGPVKNPVLILHGTASSSTDWLLIKPANNCLPLLLANNGYDVWLGNQRGNQYSKTHVKYGRTDPRFWNFSYHEPALYDIPAVIDYILLETNSSKVHCISHSAGAKIFIAGLTLRPEYNDKIGIGIGMAPAGYMHYNLDGFGRIIAPLWRMSELIMEITGPIPVISHPLANFLKSTMPITCDPRVDIFRICTAFFLTIAGDDPAQISPEMIANIFRSSPSPYGLKAWVHVWQESQSGHFRQYDYGFQRNLEVYGQSKPPDYNLSLVTAPISILHGLKDYIAPIEDTVALARQLPNVVDFYLVPFKEWTHLDFIFGKDAKTLCYDHIIEMLDKYKF